MLGLVDGNNFFVSCERVFNPKLQGRPVAVLSNNDGCVVSRSNEFKALNIAMGTPYFELKPLVKPYGLILLSSNYELYADLSRRVISTLQEFASEVNQYSIDEAFISGFPVPDDQLEDYGKTIRKAVLQWLGIPTGIGFAPTKTLAKIANHIGKKTPSGVFVMPADPRPILEKLPLDEVWGIGHRLAPKLGTRGYRNVWQLAYRNPGDIRDEFGVNLARTVLELQGTPAIPDDDSDALSQSISCSRSFGHPVTVFAELAESVAHYTAKAAEKLRHERQTARGINIYFQYYPEYAPVVLGGGYTSTTVMFPHALDDTASMLQAITPHLPRLFLPKRRYKKSGVVFFGLEAKDNPQGELFAPPASDSRLSQTVDSINKRFGRGTLFSLSEGIERSWAMKRELMTPAYTTRWNQLLNVK